MENVATMLHEYSVVCGWSFYRRDRVLERVLCTDRLVIDRSRRRVPAVGMQPSPIELVEEATPQPSPLNKGIRWPFAAVSGLGLRRLRLCLRVGFARRRQGRDVRVLELGTVLALEDRTTVGEACGLVGLVGELTLGVGLGQRTTILY